MPSELLSLLADRCGINADKAAFAAASRSSLPNPYFGAVDDDLRRFAVEVRKALLPEPSAPGRFGFLVSKDRNGVLVASWSFKAEAPGRLQSMETEAGRLLLPDASSFIEPIGEKEFEERASRTFLTALGESDPISLLDFSREVFRGKPRNPSRGGGAGLNLTFGHWMRVLLEAPEHPLPAALRDAQRSGAVEPVFYTELWCGGALPHLTLRNDSSICPATAVKPAADYLLRSCRVDEDPRRTDQYWLDASPRIIEATDSWVLADKPSGMLSVPGTSGLEDCKSRLEKMLGIEQGGLVPVHRLDMDTSGLIVYARTQEATKSLMKQFRDKEVEKIYLARLRGGPVAREGAIDLPVTTHPADRLRQIIAHGGRPSRTLFSVRSRFNVSGELFTDVDLVPQTGRTHQLRIHSAHPLGLDSPIVGDPYYGPEGIQAEAAGSVLHLHSRWLCFTDPQTGLRAGFESDPTLWSAV